jgi:hypothetical protein
MMSAANISMAAIVFMPIVVLPLMLWLEARSERRRQVRFLSGRLEFYRENGPQQFVRECQAQLLALGVAMSHDTKSADGVQPTADAEVVEALRIGLGHTRWAASHAHFEGGRGQYGREADKIEAVIRKLTDGVPVAAKTSDGTRNNTGGKG